MSLASDELLPLWRLSSLTEHVQGACSLVAGVVLGQVKQKEAHPTPKNSVE
jgi:hypothetical protein